MKKFEIINGKWIKKLEYDDPSASWRTATKLSAVTSIYCKDSSNDDKMICLWADNYGGMYFIYTKSEDTQYEADLKFLQDLLFQIA